MRSGLSGFQNLTGVFTLSLMWVNFPNSSGYNLIFNGQIACPDFSSGESRKVSPILSGHSGVLLFSLARFDLI